MHFGRTNLYIIVLFALLISSCSGCGDQSPVNFTFKNPGVGDNMFAGDIVNIQIEDQKDVTIDSVAYLLDGKLIGSKSGNSTLSLPTKNLKLGYRLISAIISHDDKKDTAITNIVLRTKQKPVQLNYKVTNVFPHDTSAYTEGLSYINGRFLESTGEKGFSKLKWVAINSGQTLQETKLDPQYFGEGSLKIGEKIIVLTWRENLGLIFDAKTFKQIGTVPYQNSKEGWGLAFNGKQILRSDGSNRIWLMDAVNFSEQGYIEVYDQNGPVEELNELEFIEGKIYANVYGTHKIVKIDPASGRVEAEIDLLDLVPKDYFKTSLEQQNNVLNGIAWDAVGKRMFVTGKKWPKLYEIKLIEAPTK